MKKLFVMIALGAAAVAAPALAQAPGGGFAQRDQTRADAQQRADTMFQMLDANHDGVVTRAEAQQALAQYEAMRGGGEGRGSGRIQRMIDMAFGSGQSITLQQFEAQALARFDAMDLNHDGTVTAAERQQARQQRGQIQPGTAAPVAATPPAAAVPPPPRH
jgi:Ca2+-binding EF-hand superfamily protein